MLFSNTNKSYELSNRYKFADDDKGQTIPKANLIAAFASHFLSAFQNGPLVHN